MSELIDILKKSFEITFKRTKEWLPLGILPCLYLIIFAGIMALLIMVTVPDKNNPTPLIIIPIIVGIIGWIITSILCAKIMGALVLYIRDTLDGRQINDVKDYLDVFDGKMPDFIKLLISVFLINILISIPLGIVGAIPVVGIVASAFGNILLGGLCQFSIINFVNHDLPVAENIKLSFGFTIKNILPLLGLMLLFGIAAFGIAFLPLSILLITMGIGISTNMPILIGIGGIIAICLIFPIMFLLGTQSCLLYSIYYYKKVKA